MKFANISIENGNVVTSRTGEASERVVNIGDQAQLIAVDHLYEYMGIKKEEIVTIEYYDLQTYDGEYVILPINFILFNPCYGERNLNFSDKIIPVFLGVHCLGNNYNDSEREYIKKFAPVGCRDEETMKLLRSMQIDAYLHGCLTAALPRAKRDSGKCGKVYFVDAPESLMKYVPEYMLEKAVFMSQQFYGKIGGGGFKSHSMRQYMEERLREYAENAALVVTSRLHCASPCAAMGIPTILAVQSYASTFSWIERLLPVYLEHEFDKIDWNPKAPDYEDRKEMILKADADRVWNAYHKYEKICQVSEFWENRQKREFENMYIQRIREYTGRFWTKDADIRYAIWGVTQLSDLVYDFISSEYKNAELAAVIDDYRDIVFKGKKSVRSEELLNHRKWKIIATGNSSSIAARKFCVENKFGRENYYTLFNSKYDDYEEDSG